MATPAEVEAFLAGGVPPSGLGVPGSVPAGTPALVVHSGPGGPGLFFGYPEWITALTGGFQPELGDLDGDGLTNLREYLHALLPGAADAGRDAGEVLEVGEGGIEFEFALWKPLWDEASPAQLRDGGELGFEWSDDLAFWTPVPGVLLTAGEVISNTRMRVLAALPGGGGRRFVRLNLSYPP
jgi:hypothetical protein